MANSLKSVRESQRTHSLGLNRANRHQFQAANSLNNNNTNNNKAPPSRGSSLVYHKSGGGKGKGSHGEGNMREEVMEGMGLFEEMGRKGRHKGLTGMARSSASGIEGGDSNAGTASSGTMEVALTDLVCVKRVKNPFLDFVLIPPPKSIMALDENEETRPARLQHFELLPTNNTSSEEEDDEEWEVLEADSSSGSERDDGKKLRTTWISYGRK